MGDVIAVDVHIIVVDAAVAVCIIVGDVIAFDVDVVVFVVYLGDKSVSQRNTGASCRYSTRNDNGFKYTRVKNNDGIFWPTSKCSSSRI